MEVKWSYWGYRGGVRYDG